MSWIPYMEKSPDCRVCNGHKVKVLRRYTSADTWGERTVMSYEAKLDDEMVVRAYCSECGIIYHEDSV